VDAKKKIQKNLVPDTRLLFANPKDASSTSLEAKKSAKFGVQVCRRAIPSTSILKTSIINFH